VLIIVNVVIYTAEIVVLTMNFWESENNYHFAQSSFLNILYICSVTAFILYGFGLFRTWRNTPVARKSRANIRRMRLTLIITIAVAISFAIRVVVNGLWVIIRKKPYHYPFEVGFYTVVEIAPIALLLLLMLVSGFRRIINKSHSDFKPLIAQADIAYTDDEERYNTAGDDDDDDDDDEEDAEPVETPGGLFD